MMRGRCAAWSSTPSRAGRLLHQVRLHAVPAVEGSPTRAAVDGDVAAIGRSRRRRADALTGRSSLRGGRAEPASGSAGRRHREQQKDPRPPGFARYIGRWCPASRAARPLLVLLAPASRRRPRTWTEDPALFTAEAVRARRVRAALYGTAAGPGLTWASWGVPGLPAQPPVRPCEAVTARWAKTWQIRGSRASRRAREDVGRLDLERALLFTMLTSPSRSPELPLTFYFGWLYEHQHGTRWSLCRAGAGTSARASPARRWRLALVFGMYGWRGGGRTGGSCSACPRDPDAHPRRVFDPSASRSTTSTSGSPRADQAASSARLGSEGRVRRHLRGEAQRLTRRTDAYIAGEGRRAASCSGHGVKHDARRGANAVAHEVGHLRDHSPGRLFFASWRWCRSCGGGAHPARPGEEGELGFDSDRDVASCR